jgi:hypothetical protein
MNADNKSDYSADEYWIDVHKELVDKLVNHIGRYKRKKEVELSELDPDTTQVYALYVLTEA